MTMQELMEKNFYDKYTNKEKDKQSSMNMDDEKSIDYRGLYNGHRRNGSKGTIINGNEEDKQSSYQQSNDDEYEDWDHEEIPEEGDENIQDAELNEDLDNKDANVKSLDKKYNFQHKTKIGLDKNYVNILNRGGGQNLTQPVIYQIEGNDYQKQFDLKEENKLNLKGEQQDLSQAVISQKKSEQKKEVS